MSVVRIIVSLGFILILFVPVGERMFKLVPEKELYGMVAGSQRPRLDLSLWWRGEWQKQANQWFEEYFGFRSYLIKTENQLNLTLFGDISTQSRTKIVLGEDGYLYEKAYIDSWNGRDVTDAELAALPAKVALLRQLQDALATRGITFLLLLSPSKAGVYPEYISRRYQYPGHTSEANYYGRLRVLLGSSGIHFFDAHEYFTSRKMSSPYPFFTRGGTHWNYYGACLITSELMVRLSTLRQEPFVRIGCDPITVDTTAYGTDRDLANLINVWIDRRVSGETPHPTITTSAPAGAKRPRILFIGDSFTWTLLSIMDERHVYAARDFFYYYSRKSSFPANTDEPIDPKKIDWQQDVLNHDIIIIEATETAIPQIGFGFVEDVLKHFPRLVGNQS